MAGVTFLAFGNGAPDVLASFSASGNEEGGLVMAVSALAGAALFVSGFVVACVTLASKKTIVLDPKTFIRDSIFYYLGFAILIVAGFYGDITIPFSISFLLLYVIFVGIVIKMDKDERRRRKELGLSSPTSDLPMERTIIEGNESS